MRDIAPARLAFLAVLVGLCSGGPGPSLAGTGTREPCGPAEAATTGAVPNYAALARCLAPILNLHTTEPFAIVRVVAVFHPARPLVAYHLFFAEDAFFAGHGKRTDHEVIWIMYDPTTFNVVDAFSLWHRAVVHTGECPAEARRARSSARFDVQWGQHGILPFGWRQAPGWRIRGLLRLHYVYARYLTGIPGVQARGYAVAFAGSFEEYVHFLRPVELSDYIHDDDVVVSEHAIAQITARLGKAFAAKKEWPN